MGVKDMIAKARISAIGALSRNRHNIDRGIDKIGEVANAKTGGRHEARIREGTDQVRTGLDKIDPTRPDRDRPDPDAPGPDTPGPR